MDYTAHFVLIDPWLIIPANTVPMRLLLIGEHSKFQSNNDGVSFVLSCTFPRIFTPLIAGRGARGMAPFSYNWWHFLSETPVAA